jgi:GNAT superfamily N-acetyltransferase
MAVKFKNYTDKPRFTKDFHKICDFLRRINIKDETTMNFAWNRWEWMLSLEIYDQSKLNKIGIWEDDDEVVAVATFEDKFGNAYLLCDDDYSYLKEEMVSYAKESLSDNGKLNLSILDSDRQMQLISRKHDFCPTQNRECVAVIDTTQCLDYSLPEGYSITSLADEYDLYKMNRVLWRGFNHEGDAPEDDKWIEERGVSVSGTHVNLDLIVAVVAPDGEFVSYCGMWYDPSTDFAIVEPVATDPKYRRMGLGRAAVLEGVRRCMELGAKVCYVGSSQQFYYSIGFSPFITQTWWELV